ncbi:MAG: gluconate 2-dehydrogenase subunit 3 family protein [Thermoleophilia bacterium]
MTDFRAAGHLPKPRGDAGADLFELPRQRRGTTPQLHGRYPDHDVLAEREHWDEPTRRVVLGRVEQVPAIRFFTSAEAATLTAFADVVLAQSTEPRIPVLPVVDDRLASGRGEGYRYADLPDDAETWRLVARGLDEAAAARCGTSFAEAPGEVREAVCADLADGRPAGASWQRLDVGRAWKVVMRDLLTAFYAHPWAWNEIGFGGPAYPRGYARLGIGLSEPWEGEEALERDPVRDVERRAAG